MRCRKSGSNIAPLSVVGAGKYSGMNCSRKAGPPPKISQAPAVQRPTPPTQLASFDSAEEQTAPPRALTTRRLRPAPSTTIASAAAADADLFLSSWPPWPLRLRQRACRPLHNRHSFHNGARHHHSRARAACLCRQSTLCPSLRPKSPRSATSTTAVSASSASPKSKVSLHLPGDCTVYRCGLANSLAFADCALGRTFSVVFKCRDKNTAMNACLKDHATPQAMDEAREEWFARRAERAAEKLRKAARKAEQEKLLREWWGLQGSDGSAAAHGREDIQAKRRRHEEAKMHLPERIGGMPAKDRPRFDSPEAGDSEKR